MSSLSQSKTHSNTNSLLSSMEKFHPQIPIYSDDDIQLFLTKVKHRPNPIIQLGPIDVKNCSFIISDATNPDMPILYASSTFTKLTGYSESEILGKNCRFLQSPDGNVQSGTVRHFCDNNVVSHMKFCIDAYQESQFSLINYRKNGDPFINLVTVIPICFNDDNIITHYLGFQIDSIDQPDSITDRSIDGIFCVDYQRKDILDTSIRMYEEAAIIAKEIQDIIKPDNFPLQNFQSQYIDNCGDFIHIISIRGLFLYVSPKSCEELLGFIPEELLGRNISDFVHPSDLVFVMRELRSSSPLEPINIICRFKRKCQNYIYLELRGHVYQGESGKRTRCIVMSGREKQAGRIFASDILVPDENTIESWAKLSPEGLILYSCPATIDVLGIASEKCFAHSVFEYVDVSDHQRLRSALQRCNQGARFYDVPNLFMHIPKGDIVVHIRLYNDGDASAKHLYCQIKLLRRWDGISYNLNCNTMEGFSPLYTNGNIFDFLKDDGSSSLYFEMNQLRVQNKRLKEEIEMQNITTPPNKNNGKERSERSGSSSSTSSGDNQPNSILVDAFNRSKKIRLQQVPIFESSSNDTS